MEALPSVDPEVLSEHFGTPFDFEGFARSEGGVDQSPPSVNKQIVDFDKKENDHFFETEGSE